MNLASSTSACDAAYDKGETATTALVQGQNVLVTGAGGLVGRHVTEALVAAGARVAKLIRYDSASTIGSLAFLPREDADSDQRQGPAWDNPYAQAAVASVRLQVSLRQPLS